MQFPSRFLPRLVPFPPFFAISIALDQLTVPQAVNDLRQPRYSDIDDPAGLAAVEEDGTIEIKKGLDEFELRFVFGWLERVIVASTKKLEKLEEGEGSQEEYVLETASSMLANLSGEGSTGEVTQVFRLPFVLTSPTRSDADNPASPHIDLEIRDTTLIGHSTGHRTWGAAPLLSQLMAFDIAKFFPSDAAPEGSTLRVLELGAGTGLVGVFAAKILEASERDFTMSLTDWQPIILENLAHNIDINELDSRTSRKELDWADFISRPHKIEPADKFDIILGADLVYDLSHITLLHATVAALLAFPTPTSRPRFHLVLPARSTHSQELEVFDRAFPTPSSIAEGFVMRQDAEERACRLVSWKRREMVGADGFQNNASRYIVYEIGWQALCGVEIEF